jgi:hypothetical protein
MAGNEMSHLLPTVALLAFGLACVEATIPAPAEPQNRARSLAMFDGDTSMPNSLRGSGEAAPAAMGTLSITSVSRPNPLWAVPLDSLSAARERPLFSPSRRPPPVSVAVPPPSAPAPSVAATPPESPPWTLLGTVVGENGGMAFLIDPATRIVTKVEAGGQAGGWLVRSVEPRSVVLEKDQRAVTLEMPKNNAGSPAIGALTGSLPPGIELTL